MTEPTDGMVTAYRQGVDDWYDPEKTTEDLLPSPHENGLRAVDRAAVRRVLDELAERVDKFYAMPAAQAVMAQWIADAREREGLG